MEWNIFEEFTFEIKLAITNNRGHATKISNVSRNQFYSVSLQLLFEIE